MTYDTLESVAEAAEAVAVQALKDAREGAKGASKALAPAAGSPLFGNGLHKALTEAKAAADALDDRLEGVQKALREHFHGGAE
jgi:hypothetical protein